MSFRFIATGDTIVTCPYTRDYDGYREMVEIIRSADVRMNNMENPLADGPCPVSSFSGRPWFRAPSSLLDEMADFGFNCYGFANNHALDYFYTGLESTIRAFEERGLPMAGAGRTLDEATRHCKVETPNGSLAMVAVTTSGDLSTQAGNPKGVIEGRPGVSMLRHSKRFFVTKEQMDVLMEIADQCDVNSRLKNRQKLGSVIVPEDRFPFGELEFEVGEPGRMTYPNANDMQRLERAVKAAVNDADHTVVYVHSHETKGASDFVPDIFAETFARSCIDWGAEAVVFSGTHQIKGVEIYRGKPIYYSIANFFFRAYDMDEYPYEWYDLYQMDPKLTVQEAENIRSKNGTRGLTVQPYAFRSIVPVIDWDDEGNITRIAVQPISLGFRDKESRGFPRPANEEDAAALLAQLKATCEPYGTEVSVSEDGLFEFKPA